MKDIVTDNKLKICKRCGDLFKPKSSRQVCCNKPIEVACIVCGKPMQQICSLRYQKETCSSKCSAMLIKQHRENTAHKLVKKCAWCGQEFIPNNVHEKYCSNTHYGTCEVCGKQFEISGRLDLCNKTCSKECRYILAQQNSDVDQIKEHQKSTMIAKYGVDNAMHIPGIVDKIKATNLERYGATSFTQTQEYIDKTKATDLERYGVEHHASSPAVIEKRRKNIQDKFGVDNVFQLDAVKNKSKQTNLERYGVEYITQNPDIVDKTKQNNLNKYGVEHPMMLPEYQEKARQTNFEKFGYAAPTQAHIHNITDWYAFIDNPRLYIANHYESSPRTEELADYFNVDSSTIDEHLNKQNATDCVRRARSLMEEELHTYILSINPECKIVHNAKKILGGIELDLYLPDYNFAIECNPTATHNSSVQNPWGGNPKSMNYHKHKTDLCEEQGIFLFHIFGYEWTHKKDIILSMLCNLLGKVDTKIYARKCEIRNVSADDAIKFLMTNHRQGVTNAKVRLGLYYNDELVSLMTFNKMRSTIGVDKSDMSDCWELSRFCSKLNTTVTGGADKLFQAFIKQYTPSKIRSFSDRSHTRGGLYTKLGFAEVNRSSANYVWVNVKTDVAYHRINAQKRHLKKFLKDDSIDLSQSENQIMVAHGYVRVYDSGTITWEWQSL